MRTYQKCLELGGEDNSWEVDINPLLPNNPTNICIAPQKTMVLPDVSGWKSTGRESQESQPPKLDCPLQLCDLKQVPSPSVPQTPSHLPATESA